MEKALESRRLGILRGLSPRQTLPYNRLAHRLGHRFSRPHPFHPDRKDWDYAFALWVNSTLGLILFWWHANRQQPGRACISVTASRTLPVLDFRALSQAQIQQAKAIFDDFKRKSFRPAYRADVDETREELDRAVLCDWLGFGESIYAAVRQLASKWCAEPSVHGGKQRHKNNTLIS